MDIEEALVLVDTLVFAKKGKYPSDIQRLLLRYLWAENKQSYDTIARNLGYSVNYLKQDVGPKLWQLLSDVCGEKVSKANFRSALERQAQLSAAQIPHSVISLKEGISPILPPNSFSKTIPNPRQDWGDAPDVFIFYDREQELSQLQQWIVADHCRLIAILGMGGIGKTHLSIKLGEQIQSEFEWVIWRSLAYAPSLQNLLQNLVQTLTGGQVTDFSASVPELLGYLMEYLKNHRCLVILDNVETILQGGATSGRYKDGYEDYGVFWRRIGEVRHQSCFLITSRENLQEIGLMKGETLPVRSWKLKGLSHSAGLKLFQVKGCNLARENELIPLIEKYGGNPLALKIVCSTIQELFAGDISNFLNHNTFIFDEICDLLAEQFVRISDCGKTFLYGLALAQYPISASELQRNIFPKIRQQRLLEILRSLSHRSLIEINQDKLSLQPVVREYLINRIISEICQEIETGEINLINTHPLLIAEAKEYLVKAQVELGIKPLIEKLLENYKTSKYLENRLGQILQIIREEPPSRQGYAAGNILNILCQLDTDLTKYDFSGLTLWSSYLPHSKLHQVNFQGADLSHSVFAKQVGTILSITFSPDGKFLATGDVNGETRLWQVSDGQLILNCKGHADWVHCVTYSPDGQVLCSASSDQTIKLWNLADGSCIRTLTGHHQRVRTVAYSPDGRILASGASDCTLKLWDWQTGDCLKTMSGHSNYIWSVAFSPDGKILASGSEDRSIKLWALQTGECLHTFRGHNRWVRTIAFSPDGTLLASGSGDRLVKIWDLKTKECIKTLEGHTQRLRSVVFSPDGSILASGGGDHTVRLWDVETGHCLKTLHGHSSRLNSVAFSPDGSILASGGEDRSLRIWDVGTGQCLKNWQGYGSWIQSVAFSPKGKTLASGSEDQTIGLWNILPQCTQSKVLSGHTGWVCSVVFSPDGILLASGSSDYTVKIWEVQTGKCLQTFYGHTRWIRSIDFSPDGLMIASCSGDASVKLWDVLTGQCEKTFKGHTGWLWSVKFSPEGKLLASGSEDKTVKLWDVHTGECRKTLTGHHSWIQGVAFSPDGQLLASASCDCSIRLWDVQTGECLSILWGHTSWVQSVAFSPDGKLLASGSCDCTIKLWDVHTGKCIKTLSKHDNWVWSVAFSPDGEILASGGQDEAIHLWDINTGNSLATLRTKRPYEGMCITEVKGITAAQRAALIALGAVE